MTRRQAVLVIHGIGDQRPMDTLRAFVDTASDAAPDKRWSRPDGVSENFDLRQLVTVSPDGVRTDFFELYWAHLMEGTRLGSVGAWLVDITGRFLRRGPFKYWLIAFGLAVLMTATAVSLLDLLLKVIVRLGDLPCVTCTPLAGWIRSEPAWLTCVELGLLAVIGLISGFLRSYVGDAARYLRARPENISARQEIRSLGVKLLQNLHDPKHSYDRIVVVGHSLGSIVGYDILNYAFAALAPITCPPVPRSAITTLTNDVRDLTNTPSSLSLRRVQDGQAALAGHARPHWKVSDFVTVGSPLTYAAVLLADSDADLAQRVRDRELPASPPVDDNFPLLGFYQHPDGTLRAHHAAPFAFTRWTNLYFPWRYLLWGDIIGGPIPKALGLGIRNVRMATRHLWGIRFFSHTSYWRGGGLDGKPDHIAALRAAIDLAGTGAAANLPAEF